MEQPAPQESPTKNDKPLSVRKEFYQLEGILAEESRKQEISRIAYGADSDMLEHILYTDHRGNIVINTPFLGCFYQRGVFFEEISDLQCWDVTETFREILVQHNEHLSPQQQDPLLEKQGSTFVLMLEELFKADPAISIAIPCLTALVACLRAGWKPASISMNLIRAVSELMDIGDAALPKDFLIALAKSSDTIAMQIIDCTLKNISQRSISQFKLELIYSCLELISMTTFSTALQRTTRKLASSKILVKDLQRSQNNDRLADISGENFALGDEVEAHVDGHWRRVSIAMVDKVRKEFLVEWNNDSQDFSSCKVSFSEIRSLLRMNDKSGASLHEISAPSVSVDAPSIFGLLSEYDYMKKILAVVFMSRIEVPDKLDFLPTSNTPLCSCGCSCRLSFVDQDFHCAKCNTECKLHQLDLSLTTWSCCWKCVSCSPATLVCLDCHPVVSREVRKTLCFFGNKNVSLVDSLDGSNFTEVGTLSHGAVIDVMDNPLSTHYRLVDRGVFVSKQAPPQCCWKEFSRQRYEMYDDVPTLDELPSTSQSTSVNFGNSAFLSSIIQEYMKIDELKRQMIVSSSRNVETSGFLEHHTQCFLDVVLEMLKKNLAVDRSIQYQFLDVDDIVVVNKDGSLVAGQASSSIDVANIFQNLLARSHDCSEKIALTTFEWMFDIIIDEITNFAENMLIDKYDLSENTVTAFSILRVIASSKSSNVLTPSFFRVMIAKCGMRAKQYGQHALRKCTAGDLDISLVLNYFQYLDKIAQGYIAAITHPLINLSEVSTRQIQTHLVATVTALGHARFTNELVANICGEREQIQRVFQRVIMENNARLSTNSVNFRRLLRRIQQYSSGRSLELLEAQWAQVLASFMLDEMQFECVALVENRHSDADCVVRLLLLLDQARSWSTVEMSFLPLCSHSAEKAFAMAFQQLPRDVSLYLIKAIVVYLSSLMDASMSQQVVGEWSESLDRVVEAIKIMFNHNSNEFIGFYEVLLARRLLSNHFFSLSTETTLLRSLPHMPKCQQFIDDIFVRSEHYSSKFKTFLWENMENDDFSPLLQETINFVVFENRFQLHVLTASLWPTFLLNPLQFSNLQLPPLMREIKKQFFVLMEKSVSFETRRAPLVHHSTLTLMKQETMPVVVDTECLSAAPVHPKGFLIQGSTENSARINGKFFATGEIRDGWPLYEMEGNENSILEYSSKTRSWQIKKSADKGKNAGWAYLKISETNMSPCSSEFGWQVWKKALKKWIPQAIVVSELVPSQLPSLSTENECREDRHQSKQRSQCSVDTEWLDAIPSFRYDDAQRLQKMVWCHAAGTVLLSAVFPDNSRFFIQLSEPQAVLLLLFSSDSPPTENAAEFAVEDNGSKIGSYSLSFESLKNSLNVTEQELNSVLLSLLSESTPLLEIVDTANQHKYSDNVSDKPLRELRFRLSTALRSKALGGSSERNPVLATTLHPGNASKTDELVDIGMKSLQDWRNQLIDAAVVRVLKHASKGHCGEFAAPHRSSLTALCADTLVFRVRNILQSKLDSVPHEDVLQRCEHLVAVGVAEKIVANPNSLSSTAFAYLPDAAWTRREHFAVAVPSDSQDISRLSHKELFDHVRMVLGIKHCEQRIDSALFRVKVLLWMGDTHLLMNQSVKSSLTVDSAAVSASPHSPAAAFSPFASVSSAEDTLSAKQDSTLLCDVFASTVKMFLCELDRQLHALIAQCSGHEPETVQRFESSLLHKTISSMSVPVVGDDEKSSNYSNNTSDDLVLQAIFESLPYDVLRLIYLNFCSITQLSPPDKWKEDVGDVDHELERENEDAAGEEDVSSLSVAGRHRHALLHELRKLWSIKFLLKQSNIGWSFFDIEVMNRFLQWGRQPGVNVTVAPLSLASYVKIIFCELQREMQDSTATMGALVSEEFSERANKSILAGFLSQSQSKTLLELLYEFYFELCVDNLVTMLNLPVKYEDIKDVLVKEKDDTGNHGSPAQIEDRIPCEFCTESIPASQFEAHVISCGVGRLQLDLGSGQADALNLWIQRVAQTAMQRAGHPLGQSTANVAAIVPTTASIKSHRLSRLRPSTRSPLASHLLEALFALHCFPKPEAYHLDVQFEKNAFRHAIQEVFQLLDRDGDGSVTERDLSLSAVPTLPPVVRNDVSCSTPSASASKTICSKYSANTSSLRKSVARKLLLEDDDVCVSRETRLSTPTFLRPSDSLWVSVSHEKHLPVDESVRCFRGLDQTEEELQHVVENTQSILDESESDTTALLVHYKWDVAALVEDYLDNARAVRLGIGLSARSRPPLYRYDYYLNQENSKSEAEAVRCGICGDDVPNDQAFALSCLHWYCSSCWQGYLENAVHDRKLAIHCAHPKCNYLVTLDTQRNFLNEKEMKESHALLLKSFVEEKRGQKVVATYCKNPKGCAGVVFLSDDGCGNKVVCSLCSTSFCASCDLPPHEPASCEMVAAWESRGGYIDTGRAEETEARKLKHLTTKPCPRCGVRIEKDGGCPHMTCMQPNCRYQFCWECSGEFHTSRVCTRKKISVNNNSILMFDELDKQGANHFLARQVALSARADLERFLASFPNSHSAAVAKTKYTAWLIDQDRVGSGWNEENSLLDICRTIHEAWSLLAEAQSALAHACIVMFTVRSVKIQFMFDRQKELTVELQQNCEEIWTDIGTFPAHKAKMLISHLQKRLKTFLVEVQSEILHPTSEKTEALNSLPSIIDDCSSTENAIVFGNAFGGSRKVYSFGSF